MAGRVTAYVTSVDVSSRRDHTTVCAEGLERLGRVVLAVAGY
jgi:hypothetical protein